MENNIPFQLANQGFDVFVADFRGSSENSYHLFKEQWSHSFWNYSLDELISEDLVKIYEEVIQINPQPITVVAHSLGGTIITGAFAEQIPLVVNHTELVINLGASFYLKETDSFLTRFFALFNLPRLLQQLGLYNLTTNMLYLMSKYIPQLFIPIARLSMDYEGSPLDTNRIHIISSVFPANTAIKLYEQLYQILITDKFQKFDFGEE